MDLHLWACPVGLCLGSEEDGGEEKSYRKRAHDKHGKTQRTRRGNKAASQGDIILK